MKAFIYLIAELVFVAVGGCIGMWLPVRNIPAGSGSPGDGMGMLLFGSAGMLVGGMVGVLGLVIFWSVLEMKSKARIEAVKLGKIVSQDAGVWPPAPKA